MSVGTRWFREVLGPVDTWGVTGERAARGRARGGARESAWLAVAALLVGVVATPFGVDPSAAEFGRLSDGILRVQTDDGWHELEAPAAVPSGAQLHTTGGSARVETGGAQLTLASATQLRTDPDAPRVTRGGLLVESREPYTVRVGATAATGTGQWRVDVGVASRVATYRAEVALDDGTSRHDLDRFRQVSVRDGALSPGQRPLRYAHDDTWDQWLLAEALAVDRLGARLRDTLERRHGRDPREADFFAAFVAVGQAGLAPELRTLAVMVDGDAFGPPADVLLGVAVLDALRVETALAPHEALERMVELRRAGGSWGLVLVEHGLGAAALRAAADRALRRVERTPPPPPEGDGAPADPVTPVDAEAPPSPGSGTEAVTPPDPAPGADTDPSPGVGAGPAPGAGTDPSSPRHPGGQEPADSVREAIGEASDEVDELAEETRGTVGDLVEEAGGEVGELVGEAVDGLVGATNGMAGDLGGAVSPPVGDLVAGAGGSVAARAGDSGDPAAIVDGAAAVLGAGAAPR